MKFTRYFGHFEGDQQTYRAGEVAMLVETLDCLIRFRRQVTEAGQLDDSDLDAIDSEVGRLIADAIAQAKAAPEPAEATC